MNKYILDKRDSILISIDIQEKILPAMFYKEELIKTSNILLKSFNLLEIPIIATEQYPKGLGKISDIINLDKDTKIFEKTTFSIFGSNSFVEELKKYNKKNIIIFGIETHVCVFQSVYDAIESGYNVYVVKNACSSRFKIDHETAICAMKDIGAHIITTEMAIFNHLKDSAETIFKSLSKIIK